MKNRKVPFSPYLLVLVAVVIALAALAILRPAADSETTRVANTSSQAPSQPLNAPGLPATVPTIGSQHQPTATTVKATGSAQTVANNDPLANVPAATTGKTSGSVRSTVLPVTASSAGTSSQSLGAGPSAVAQIPGSAAPSFSIYRTPAEILAGKDLSDPVQRAIAESEMTDAEEARYAAVLAKAQQMGIPVRIEGPAHNVQILYDIREEGPLYRKTLNTNAAISTGANLLNKTPYNLNGQGMTVGVWDEARARTNHVELVGKVTVGDSTTANSDHGTHVAGTIAAKGVDPKAKGMGTNTLIRTYDWNNDYSEMTAIGAANASQGATKLPISNHSYGYNATSADMGRYETECNTLDALAKSLPYYLVFWAAGNEQDLFTSLGGYQSITFNGLAKNIMTVGAADDAVTGGSRDVSKGTLAYFSSMGPCDDGRIKPDIVANGVSVYSCVATGTNTYDGTYSGTSMATPNAAGTAALLVQLYKTNFSGQLMPASMLKALMIHTADDVGRPGPDYQYGWGYMNGKAAADVILAHKASLDAPKMIENTIDNANKTRATSFVWDGTSPIRATVVWTDVEGAAQTATNSRTRNLVNDLDLKITAPNGTTTYLPYVMPFVGVWTTNSMTNNAVTGTNKVDNVERVDIPAPTQAGTYTVTVGMYGTNTLSGTSQAYSLVVTGGAAVEANPAPVVNVTAPADGVSVLSGSPITITATATDMAVGGMPGSVTKVEFFDGDTLLGEDTSEPYQWSWTPATSGARVLTAKATDNENATTVSSPVTVNVLVGNGAPGITSFSPTGGVAGESVVVTGTNLGLATLVRFGALTSTFVANSSSQLTATVPDGAVTAPIVVSNAYGIATSITNFNILPILFREDFSSIVDGNNTTSGGSSTAWTGNSNFPTGVNDYQAGGAVKLGSSSAVGSITSRAINLSGNGGAFTLSFKVKGWSTVEGQIKVTAGAQSQTVSYTATMTGEFETKTLNFTGGTATTTIKIETTAKRAFIDDVVVTSEAPTSPPVITSPVTAGGIAGTAFSYQIAASNSPTSFGASNLPLWASINTTSGVISGANPTTGANVVSIFASNSVGVGSTNLTITIIPSGGGGGGVTNTIFSENMGTPAATTTISNYAAGTAPSTFQNKGVLTFGQGDQANPADVRVSSGSSSYSGASGNGNIFFTSATNGVAPVDARGFSVEGINAAGFTNLQVAYGYRKESASLHATFSVDYWNGSSWTSVANTASALFNEATNATAGWYLAKSLTLPAGAQINGLKLRFVKTGTNAIRIDDVKLTGVSSSPPPSISASGSLSAVDTTYGAASASPTSFTVSGSNLVTGITVAPPAGFEVSAGNTNAFAGQGSSIIVGSAGAVSNTTVFVRLAADADFGTYSGNIVCSSVGASNASVATAVSTVSPKGISVTANLLRKTYGAEDPELTYTSSEPAPFSGSLTRAPGENVGVYAISQGDLSAGSNYAITFTGNNFEITRKNISITANDITKTFGQSLSLGAGQTGFSASGLVNGETVGSVTLASSGAASAAAIGTYPLIPSAATGGTFTPSNYSIIYNSGTLSVTGAGIPTFEQWMSNYPQLTGGDVLASADPDKDGIANLLEYYMGLSPVAANHNAISVSFTPGSPSSLSMSYRRSKNITNVVGGVSWISTLTTNNWSTNGVTENAIGATDYEDVTATVTNGPSDAAKFLRLRVTQP
jgi:hypothetical protein